MAIEIYIEYIIFGPLISFNYYCHYNHNNNNIGLVEKLGDIKLKKPAGECLEIFAEKTSLQFVLSQSYPVWKKAKSPKVLADSLMWIQQALLDFGINRLQIRDLIEFVKIALGNTNASVRTSAVTVLGVLRRYIGPGIISKYIYYNNVY